MPDHFKEPADQLLRQLGLAFTGIHLHCRRCGEEAFAADTKLAAVFGWSHLQRVERAEYQGLCLACSNSVSDTKGASS